MRLSILAVTGAVLALSGCVITTPMPQPLPSPTPVPTPAPAPKPTPTVLDAASRAVARNAVNAEMSKRLPGVNVAPYTDCIVNNATTAELIDIAQATRAGASGVGDSVAVIVKRPAASQCIAAAAKSA